MQFWLVRRSALERYAAAIVFTAAAALTRHLLDPWLGANVPFLTLYPALFLSSLVGGGGPGLVSLALGSLVSLALWIPPTGSFVPATLPDLAAMVVFLFTGFGISYVAHAAWRLHLELLDSNSELMAQRRRAEQWLEQTQRGQRVIAAFSKSLTAGEIISVILDEAMLAVDAQAAIVLRVVNEGRDLEVAQAQGIPAGVLEAWRRFSIEQTPNATAAAVRTREAIYIEHLDDWRARYPDGMTLAERAGYRASAILPFVVATRPLGALLLAFSSPRVIDSSDRLFLERLAHQCAVALERVNAYEAEQRARLDSERQRRRAEKLLAQSRRLQAVSASFSRSLTSDDVMHQMMTEGLETMGAAAALVSRLSPTGTMLNTVLARGIPNEVLTSWRNASLEESPARAEVIRQNRPIYVLDQEAWRQRYPGTVAASEQTGLDSFAIIPLTLDGRAVGTFGLSFVGRLPLDDDDRVFLESLGHYCSIALERARTYEAERGARLEAEETNRLKDAFLATVSHELRTPLNAILGWADLLRRGVLPADKRARAVQAIGDNARRQAELTGNLLDMSRIIAGKVRLEMEPVDVETLVRQAVDVVQPAADAKDVEVVVRSVPLPTLWSDPGRLQQVLWNLLSNAVKFTPPAGRVEVQLASVDGFVEIHVTDTGDGIPPAFLPHVFEPFRQGDDSLTRGHGGLGLGLSIVRHLVELHGGTVRARSAGSGLGSTFIVRLPGATRPIPRGEALVSLRRAASTPIEVTTLDGIRILVVENEDDSREAMAIALRSYGAVALTASDADDARAMLDQHAFDVILVDIGLPHEDGYSLLRSIRARDDHHAVIRAAAITAYTRPEDRSAAAAAGFDVHLVKPLDGTSLAAAIGHLLSDAAMRTRDG